MLNNNINLIKWADNYTIEFYKNNNFNPYNILMDLPPANTSEALNAAAENFLQIVEKAAADFEEARKNIIWRNNPNMERLYTIRALFEEMRTQLEVMAEHGDNEHELLQELKTCDDDILNEYKAVFLD